jgi:hypothetical protein
MTHNSPQARNRKVPDLFSFLGDLRQHRKGIQP